MEDLLRTRLQLQRGHCLRDSVGDGRDGDFILPLLQSRIGLGPVSWSRRWPRVWR